MSLERVRPLFQKKRVAPPHPVCILMRACEEVCRGLVSMNLYVMRHGRTNYNELGLCNDDPNADVYLDAPGKQQAQVAAEQLRDIAIDRIIVSPLPRTLQTAEIVNQYHDAPIEIHPDIADIRSGFDGKPVSEYFAAIAHDPLNARANGGESLLDHKRRVLGFIEWLQRQPQENILVVAHEETLRVFVTCFEGNVPDEQLRDVNIGNCEVRYYKTGDCQQSSDLTKRRGGTKY